jgi:spermidine synthase
MDGVITVARADGPRGEVVLRRRGIGDDAVDELIVNGAFAMDSAETTSERTLANLAYEFGPVGGRMLIGGLGLGYTVHEALNLPVGRVDVVEVEECLVRWCRQGLTPVWARLATEPRVHLKVADVAAVLLRRRGELAGPWDAIALDVDNGPDFLIHPENTSLYTPDLLRQAYDRLTPGGRLAIWCQAPSPSLLANLTEIASTAAQHVFKVERGDRRLSYAVCTLDRPLT